MAFVLAHFKNILLGISALAIIGALWWGYNATRIAAQNEIVIEVLKEKEKVLLENIEDQRRIAALNEIALKLANDAIEDRDNQIEAINEQFETITENLGDDVNDQAAESLKELFRRIKAGTLK